MVKDQRKSKIFYGWWIVLATNIARAFSGGFYFYGFSTFFMPLVNDFGWSRTALSGAFSLSRIEGGLLGPVGGFLIDRFGPRIMMLVGISMMGTGFILLSRINSLVTFYLVFILLIALGATIGINRATLVAIVNWFAKKRGIALGLAGSGVGIGGLFVPFLAWLIVTYDWRGAAVITGIILWIIGIPLALVMRHRPEPYGYLPDGEVRRESMPPKKGERIETDYPPSTFLAEGKVDAKDIDFTPRQALKTTTFWILALTFGLRQMAMSGVVIHQIPFLIDIGIPPEVAATVLGSLALISIVGRVGLGRLSDIINKRYVMAFCLALMAIGCFILASAQTVGFIILFLIVYAPAYGGGSTLMHALRGDYFGRRYYATITGFMDLIQMFGLVLGPIFAGWVFDVSGDYRLAFITFAIALAVAMVLMLTVRRPVVKPKVTQG